MSAQVFIKLFAIFAVVAVGWGAAKSGRLGRRPARVLAGAAFYVCRAAFRTSARIRFDGSTCASSSPSSRRRWRCSARSPVAAA
jgi:hypothetical protein